MRRQKNMSKYMIINGPNLDQLGKREPDIYGDLTLEEIKKYTSKQLNDDSISLEWYQSNVEGELINKVHSLMDGDFKGLLLNPGGYSHTSVALYDALSMLTIPVIELHLSNIYCREEFRQTMLTARASVGIIGGLGKDSYHLGARALKNLE